MAAYRVAMLDAPCDRCGRQSDRLHPFTATDTITYRGRVIEEPWLCLKCFTVEKKKWRKRPASDAPAGREKPDGNPAEPAGGNDGV